MADDVKIYKAELGSLGRVVIENELTEDEAAADYAANEEIVVCGDDKKQNRRVAQRIASTAGKCRRETPHKAAGPYSLPHYQPETRPPDGHVFYETDKRKAAKKP